MIVVAIVLVAAICVIATFKILGNWFLPAHVAAGIGRAVDNTVSVIGKLIVVGIGLGVLWGIGFLVYAHSTGATP